MRALRPIILYRKGTVQKLAKQFNVTESTVRLALRMATEGDRPDQIRKEALENYGAVLVKEPLRIKNTTKYTKELKKPCQEEKANTEQ